MDLELYGMQQLRARLFDFKEVMETDTADILKECAMLIRDDAKAIVANEAYDTGALFRSIRLQVYAPKAGQVTRIGVSAGGYEINYKTGRLVDYAAWVEFGSSRFGPGIGFMQRAMFMHLGDITTNIVNKLKRKD
jgi:hypothetical protein